MRGHEALIAMRLRRRKVPRIVFFDFAGGRSERWRTWQFETPDRAYLLLDHGDVPGAMDLRCVVGLTVWINHTDEARVIALRDACMAAGADRVIAHVSDQVGEGEYAKFPLRWCTDTAGFMTWPS